MKPPFKVVIPARFGSTRLPGKPLLMLAGKPLIAHVCQVALASEAEEVVVATDNQYIFDCVTELGIPVVMTASKHQNGSERVNQVAMIMGWDDATVVVNLQGDEPLIPASYVSELAQALSKQGRAGVATLATEVSQAEVTDSNTVKVVLDSNGYALYFSRAPIPYQRGGKSATAMPYLRHIGIYAYTVRFLKHYCGWQQSVLESMESLEQLRILWHGETILVRTVPTSPPAGIDTQADLERVEQLMLSQRG